MKVAELKEKLGKLKKEEVVKLAVEFYKRVPKAKREYYDLDDLVNSPPKQKEKAAKVVAQTLHEVEAEVTTFIEHVRAAYYYDHNKIVPRKERINWRFKVKRWYKALTNKKIEGDLQTRTDLLTQLYVLMCEAAGYYHFSTTDPFHSIGVSQIDFYKTVLTFTEEAEGKPALVEKGIDLIIQNGLDRETLYSWLMLELVEALNIPDLKYEAIEKTRKLTAKNGFVPPPKEKKKGMFFSSSKEDFYQQERHNNYTELVFRLYMSLYEQEKAIAYHKAQHYQRDEEIKLYILISLLFVYKKTDLVRREIETGIEQGIKPRGNLIKMLDYIKEKDALPKAMNYFE